ncbi:NUDIX hydrolase [Aquirufa regiilacus]|uniref:NUDIX domain-containing protein n=1 Tax=Aquirufa regiilacus TaxID=3024868 RepID=A0ABU3TU18_9BACT|nr:MULTISPECIES: NUDIX domain-containing protein [unclassified Aquirufa]MDT8887684.1 NUDIX domain-containing protein [Aquirufa sp. LEPPI-3A]MDU0809304.1 NUDIX domain-containing protein [Aquirufa sp. LEOWEIH-7C]
MGVEAQWLPGISVDCVIFGFHENQLKVLLLKFKKSPVWALAGGFVGVEEDVDQAAQRILEERTGLTDIYLEQFYTFGDLARNYRATEEHRDVNAAMGRSDEDVSWLSKRYITIGYYALVDYSKVQVNPSGLSDASEWMDVSALPKLFLDHNRIVIKALESLRRNLDEKLVAFELLGDTFTMSELQMVYETILGKRLVRTNFQRKILSLEILERIEKKYTGGAHKAPYLYRLKK